MNKARLLLLKNKELVLYITCFLSHCFFAPIYNHFGFKSLFYYNVSMSFVYGIFILLFNNNHRRFFINFAYLEIIFYSLFVTILTGTDFGTRVYVICIIPALFFFVYSAKSERSNLIILSIIATFITLLIIWYQYARPRAIYTGFMTAVTVYKSFYRIHVVFSSLISLFLIFYLSIITETDLIRSTEKTKIQTRNLELMANHDQLTGLMNRRKATLFIKKMEELKNKDHKDFAISIFDIDGFKSVNDTWGHDAGDFILKNITGIISTMLPANVQFARWGGEEFLLMFNDYSPEVISLLEKIRMEIEKTVNNWNGNKIKITLTFGVSSSRSGANSDKIIIEADNRLFWGKQNGKNRVVVSEDF